METFHFVLSLTSLWISRSYSMTIKRKFLQCFLTVKFSICLDFEERCCFTRGIFLAIANCSSTDTIVGINYFIHKKSQRRCFLLLTRLFHPSTLTYLYPYQIQHCFECIFKLFLKTVFNLFCEIGFK